MSKMSGSTGGNARVAMRTAFHQYGGVVGNYLH